MLYVLIDRETILYDIVDRRVVFSQEVVDSHGWAEPMKFCEFVGVKARAMDPVARASVRQPAYVYPLMLPVCKENDSMRAALGWG